MTNYDFTTCLSPLDFELLSKDLLEAELGIRLENFKEGRDKGIDLRYAPNLGAGHTNQGLPGSSRLMPLELIVQCKRYSTFGSLKSELKNKELDKIAKLNPPRYILTTSVSLSPDQATELKDILSPFVQSTGDIFGRERLNASLNEHKDIERRHLKLWVGSAGVLDSIIHAGTHIVSREEVERSLAAAKLYVHNPSFDDALATLRDHHVCIISGIPGIGKTTLARMLLLYYHRRGYDVVMVEEDIKEARAVGYHRRPRFYLYNDFLGQSGRADKLNKNEDQRLIDFMRTIRESADSVFVLTTREYILNQAKFEYEKLGREKFDQRMCIVDLARYSRRIRAQILYNHLYFSKLPRFFIEALVVSDAYIRIIDHHNYNPRLIEVMTDPAWIGTTQPSAYSQVFIENLDNPTKIWTFAYRDHLSDRCHHLLLVLTTMPGESLLADVERAFTAFHHNQCLQYNVTESATDFISAVQELEGTFLTTRLVLTETLVSFQNPSVCDFMQNKLLGGERLIEVIENLVFFEQAKWFAALLFDEEAPELENERDNVTLKLLSLIDADRCSVKGNADSTLWENSNILTRLADIAQFVSDYPLPSDIHWIEQRLLHLATQGAFGELEPFSFGHAIGRLHELGFLETDAGKYLLHALKLSVLSDPSDLADFGNIAALVHTAPESFKSAELHALRLTFSEFANRLPMETDESDPVVLRELARAVRTVGDSLGVNTEDPRVALRNVADEFEKRIQPCGVDGDTNLAGTEYDQFSFDDLQSMFGTLIGHD